MGADVTALATVASYKLLSVATDIQLLIYSRGLPETKADLEAPLLFTKHPLHPRYLDVIKTCTRPPVRHHNCGPNPQSRLAMASVCLKLKL